MVSPWKGRGIKGVFIPICPYSKINFLHRLKGLLCISTKAIVRFFMTLYPEVFFVCEIPPKTLQMPPSIAGLCSTLFNEQIGAPGI